MHIRQPVVAGRFYPDGPEDLRQEVLHFLDAGARALPAPRHTTPVALMLPHAGHVFCGQIIGATLAGMRLPRTLILLCPNHTGMGRPLSVWPDGAWLTPLGPVTVDAGLAAALCEGATVFEADTHAHLREHALEVILPFLQVRQPEPFRIVPVCVGTRQREVLHQAGRDLARLLAGRLLPASPEGDGRVHGLIVVADPFRIFQEHHQEPFGHCLVHGRGPFPIFYVQGIQGFREHNAWT